MVRNNNEQNVLRRYLLMQLSASEQETVELRLLSDDDYSEELDIVEDELIDEFLAGELSRSERQRFQKFFLAYTGRRRKLQSAQVFKRHFEPDSPPIPPARVGFFDLRKWIPSVRFPIAVPAVALLVVVALASIIWRGGFLESDVDKGLVALNEAYRQERPIEARVSKLDYAPFIVTRGNEPETVNTLERSRAERLLTDAFQKRPDVASYHALGKFYLLQRQTVKAIQYLEFAQYADSKDAQIYADLGAAYLEKGKRELEGSPLDHALEFGLLSLGRGLEHLNHALELDPNLLEALFNRALVHQYQGLDQQAEADWRSYLQKDPNSQWAKEAQQKLKLLEEKKQTSQNSADPLPAFLQAYRARDDETAWGLYKRRHGTSGNEITRSLVDDILANNEQSGENLQALKYLGQLEHRKTQDSYTSDVAQVYASASPATKALLAQARQEMNEGYKLFHQNKMREATESFTSALGTFEKAGDLPEYLAAEVLMAHAAAIQPDLLRGQEILSRITPSIEVKHYKWLHAKCLTWQATIDANLKNYSKAISNGDHALLFFRESQDMTSVFGSLVQVGSLYLFLQDNETSLSYLQRAVAIARDEIIPPLDLWGIHIAISLNLTGLKLYRAALDYQNEALQVILPLGIPLLNSRNYQYIGLTYGALKQFDLALQNGRLAYDQGKPLSAERSGKNMMASASLMLGDVYRNSGNPTAALAAYDESSRLYEALDFPQYNYAAHKGQFLSYVALNNDARATQELVTVLNLFDEYREKIVTERQQMFFFDREHDTYDLAIDFVYSRLGDPQRAFDYSETSRSRSLRELMQRGAEITQSERGLDVKSSTNNGTQTDLPLSATETQQRLPERVQLVEYAVLEKKLLVWLITRSTIVTKSVDIDSAKLAETVATALRRIRERDDTAAQVSLKILYEFLIEPVREQLDRTKVVCFVPDKSLHYVPFDALVSARSGRYLVQDFMSMTSPSATILIESTERANARANVKKERLLAVGNPAFDRKANPGLANLPDAEREVAGIATAYTSSPLNRVLLKGEATRSSIIDDLMLADVAHFAAHFEIDPKSSLYSRLMVGQEHGERAHAQPSGLSSGDIYGMKLTRTRLVVLSGCKTGIEQQFAGEGAIGLARSFLVAGVPVVVASLWPVDSDATAELMIAFHRYRKIQLAPTTEALMLAQRDMITRGNYRSPYYWAGFTVIGGYADF